MSQLLFLSNCLRNPMFNMFDKYKMFNIVLPKYIVVVNCNIMYIVMLDYVRKAYTVMLQEILISFRDLIVQCMRVL